MFDNETVLEEQPTWVADLLFLRANRTNRNYADGSPLFFADFENGLFWSQFLENLSILVFYLVSLSLNFLLFAMSIAKPSKSKRKKLPCLIANLAFCNIILCTGFVIYTLVLDVYLETDSLESLIEQIENTDFRSWIWIGKEIIHIQLIENMIFAQSINLLFISFDRYCSLFPNYSPYVKKPWLMFVICTLPYLNSHLLLSYEILNLEFDSAASIGL
uniref:G_PROTEIN_RECEP_F1_2 domain-containing protein n=1 Tax=Steinernema glaseri TaxID=37863 RepID=A0A1I7YS21_9BILA